MDSLGSNLNVTDISSNVFLRKYDLAACDQTFEYSS